MLHNKPLVTPKSFDIVDLFFFLLFTEIRTDYDTKNNEHIYSSQSNITIIFQESN